MNKEEKAKEYADWLHKNVEEFYGRWCDPKDMYYKNGDIRMAFETGWDEALSSQWVKVEDKLPDVDISVLVLTSNKKVSMSKRYQPKDCKGNDVGLVCWSGSYTFVNSIVAWMPIPPFDKILKQLKDWIMKPRTYQAKQLDPRTIVIPLADYNKAVNEIRNEAKKAYESLYKIGKIDDAILQYLKDRLDNVLKNK